MTNRKTTGALLSSVIALILCCAMLVGSTFAWFTDSASTAVNNIVSGTLDIVLLNGTVSAEGKPMEFVAADGRETILWEPGCTYKTPAYTLKNNGNLALKYEIIINGINGNSKLLEVIDFTLSTESGVLLPGESVTVQLTGHMAEEAGNEYQGLTLSGVGLTVNAYQHSYEKDSIDESYDAVVHNEKQLMDALAAGENVKLGGDIALTETVEIPAGVIVNLNGHTLSAEWIETTGAARVVNGTVKLPADSYIYSDITLENVVIDSDSLSVMAYTGGTITLKDVTFKSTSTSNPLQNYGGTLVLENVTVSQEGDANTAWYSSALQVVNEIAKNDAGKWDVISQANTTINSGNYTGKKALMISAPGGNVTINGGNFVGSEYAIQDDFAPQNYPSGANYKSVITINGGTFEGALKISADTKLTICGGTFTADPSEYVASGYKVVKNDGIYYVMPENVFVAFEDDDLQSALDSATEGTTIFLVKNVSYGAVAIRPTANNDTTMVCTSCDYTTTDAEAFKAHMDNGEWHGTPDYTTEFKNLTIIGAEGATVAGFTASSSHVVGPAYDYVRGYSKDAGSTYFCTLNISNLTFRNVAFTGKVNIYTSDEDSVYDGVTFTGCSFTTGGTESTNGAGLRYYNEYNNGNVKNITVTGCTFTNCYQGVYVHHVNGVTVTGCTFDIIGHNAIAMQNHNGAVNLKNVVITGNTFTNIADRVIRFNAIGADSNITIQNNTATNSGDENGEVMKATSIASGVVTNISGNTWNGTVVNTELQDK